MEQQAMSGSMVGLIGLACVVAVFMIRRLEANDTSTYGGSRGRRIQELEQKILELQRLKELHELQQEVQANAPINRPEELFKALVIYRQTMEWLPKLPVDDETRDRIELHSQALLRERMLKLM
jgi:hypothetical protein